MQIQRVTYLLPGRSGTRAEDMLIGYARVSTSDQNLDLQLDALTRAGCDRVFSDIVTGVRSERSGLADALSYSRSGDELVVWKLDRLGRTVRQLVPSWKSSEEEISASAALPTGSKRQPRPAAPSFISWLLSRRWNVTSYASERLPASPQPEREGARGAHPEANC